jgi:hypothetical protein
MFECLLWSTLRAVATVLPGMGELSHSTAQHSRANIFWKLSIHDVCVGDRFEAPAAIGCMAWASCQRKRRAFFAAEEFAPYSYFVSF